MKITRVTATPVNIPLDAPFLWSAGLYGGSSKSIIQIETDAGLIGLGEAPWWHFGPLIEQTLAPILIGQDPLDIAGIESRCIPPFQITANTGENAALIAYGAVEMALWDIRGKRGASPSIGCSAARCARRSLSQSTSASGRSKAMPAAR